MFKFMQKLTAIILASALLPQIAFAAAPPKETPWLQIPNLESRKSYPVDRGEACTYLISTYTKMTGTVPSVPKNNPFSDVDASVQPSILQAQGLGIVNGTQKDIFQPNHSITKGDFSVMVYRLIKNAYPNATLTGSETLTFPDKIEPYALVPLQFTYSRGFLEKDKTLHLGANEKISLGEMASVLERAVRSAPDFKLVTDKFNTKRAYLTFDDGTSKNTPILLNTLKKYNAKATFFVTGKSDVALLKRIKEEGHVIGNHTMSHKYDHLYASSVNFWSDFDEEQKYLKDTIDYTPVFFRFPGGSNNAIGMRNKLMPTLAAQAKSKNYIYVDWNVDSGDAMGHTMPKKTIVNNVLTGSKNKTEAVILMHQTAPKTTTAEALPEIIEGLQKMGFDICPLTTNSYHPMFIK